MQFWISVSNYTLVSIDCISRQLQLRIWDSNIYLVTWLVLESMGVLWGGGKRKSALNHTHSTQELFFCDTTLLLAMDWS